MSLANHDQSCIFCKIINGENPSKTIYRDEFVTAFHDIHPVAPIHILIIPNKHLHSLNTITSEDKPLIGHMFDIARQIAVREGVDQSGYRLILNTGPNAGQTIFHLHLHLIGGQRMRFPMG